MHAVQISFFVDPEGRSPETLLVDWHSLGDIAGAVASTGARVTVIQASLLPGIVERSGITFHFMVPDGATKRLTRSASFRSLIQELAPDVLHVHGLSFAREVLELRSLVGDKPILLQDHADRVPFFWKRGIWRRAAASASGVSFCARAQAEPFHDAAIFESDTPVFEIPESTSTFVPGDQDAARNVTGVYGNPAVIWVGHLNANKDPLTVLEAVSAAVDDLHGLQLWCCYGLAPLLPQIEKRIASDERLRDRVHLLGQVPHARVEQLMRAGDLFVLGSHREGGNFSLIEALATGLTPIVTDIPSSRALIAHGEIGALWPCGNSSALATELRSVWGGQTSDTRSIIRAYFDAHLSSSAIGHKFTRAYKKLLESTPPSPAVQAAS